MPTMTMSVPGPMALMLACATLFLVPAPAPAQERGTTIASIKGECTKFVVGGQKHGCSGVLYMTLPNGRVTFTVALPDGALTFSGGQDSQLSPTRYVLEIDTIRAGRKNGRSYAYKARGRCTMNLSSDGDIVHDLACSAHNGTEDVVLEFRGDGSKIAIDRL